MHQQPSDSTNDWLQPPAEQEGLRRYVETLRERAVLIVAITALTTAVAIAYLAIATKMYQAQSSVLVTPVSTTDPAVASLGLISASSDPTRDVQTVAQLIADIDVATAVRQKLKLSATPSTLLSQITAVPVAQSNIVAVTAESASPEAAQELANAFSEESVRLRTRQLHERIDERIPRLEGEAKRLRGIDSTAATSLEAQIVALGSLRSGPDPTIQVETLAALPTAPASPRPVLTVVASILAGLILGIGAAFAFQTLDPRLRREAQLRRLYRLPILARVPTDPSSRGNDLPLAPTDLDLPTAEAYRTLRATLSSRTNHQTAGRMILVTGASASEGKTSTAINLAASLALAGRRVILIEADLRRPSVGAALHAYPASGGVVSVLIENTTLDQALVQSPTYGPNLRVLLADYEGGWISDLFSIPAAARMLQRAKQLADFVVVDAPPLYDVIDALPIAEQAEEVLMVVRLGRTRLDKIHQLAELLADNNITPAGFVVVGAKRPEKRGYYFREAQEASSESLARAPSPPQH